MGRVGRRHVQINDSIEEEEKNQITLAMEHAE